MRGAGGDVDNAVIAVFIVGGDRNDGDDEQEVDGEEPEGPAPRPARVKQKAHTGQSGGSEGRERWCSDISSSFYNSLRASWLSALLTDVTLPMSRSQTRKADPVFQSWSLRKAFAPVETRNQLHSWRLIQTATRLPSLE
jgi:hypothetical protein